MGINPAMAASLAALFQQGQQPQPPPAPGSAMPTAPPANTPMPASIGAPGGNAGTMQDYAGLAAGERQQILASPPAQEAARERGAAQGFAAQRSQTPLPQMGPQITKGAGFLHNLGQALQMISMATRPGQAIFGQGGPVYGPKIAQYRATQAGLMGQEQAATKAGEESGKEVQALAGISKPAIYGSARVEAARVSAGERAQAAMLNHDAALKRIAAMKDINQQTNAMREEVTRMRDETQQQIAAQGNITKEDIAGQMVTSAQTILNTKEAQELGPAFANMVKSVFGLAGVEAPGGASPVQSNAPLPKRNAGAGKFKEGDTATGPNGHKIVFRGGKWVDAPTKPTK